MTNTLTADLTRPIVGIENRTAQEVFDIMSDRIKRVSLPSPPVSGGRIERLHLPLDANNAHHALDSMYSESVTGDAYMEAYELVSHFIRASASPLTNEPVGVTTLRKALTRYVYETTCMSPLEDDGSHWCKISAQCLSEGRDALSKSGATVGPSDLKSVIDLAKSYVDSLTPKDDAHKMFAPLFDRLSAAIGEPRRAALEGET